MTLKRPGAGCWAKTIRSAIREPHFGGAAEIKLACLHEIILHSSPHCLRLDVLSGVTATALGTGKTNTASIVALYPAEDNAARFCADFSVTEGTVTYDDWFLPSKDELYKLYETRVNYFEDGEYWSSSEIDATHAWGFVFSGFGWDIRIKNGIERVRPVRYF